MGGGVCWAFLDLPPHRLQTGRHENAPADILEHTKYPAPIAPKAGDPSKTLCIWFLLIPENAGKSARVTQKAGNPCKTL